MSEEVKKASLNVPRAMFFSLMINGSLALGMMIIVLASAGDPAIYAGSSYPFIPIFANVFQSNAAATGVTAVILVIQFVTTIGGLASASRMVWSFSRDRGLPGWSLLSQVDSRSTIPLAAIALVTIAGCLLSLINVGSALLEALFSSYLICCSLLLYRRVKGQVGMPAADGDTTSEAPYTWGPWHLKGKFGILNNVFACGYLIFICFFSFWPAQTPVTAATMNYSSLVTGAVVLFSIVYYLLWAKRTYQGPIVEVRL
ncbi:amino acid polyamine transporter I protein [Rutstroemia sp. NJR-2017a BBW]|nr:amino acid polyamine transporter I protein [Rutstroemia sp. NJR-2017a BBW]